VRIVIEMAGPPFGKAQKFHAPNGGIFNSSKAAFSREEQLRRRAEALMNGRSPTSQPLIVTIECRFPLLDSWSQKMRRAALAGVVRPDKKPDWDNIGKLCDCLNKVVWMDDKQIVEGRVIKIYSEHPGLTIIIQTWQPPTLEYTPTAAGIVGDLFPSEPRLA
jgi:Holliday junction resolvase RusA-like endonuclease